MLSFTLDEENTMAKIGGSSRGDSPFGGDAGDDKSTNHEPEDQTAEGYGALAQRLPI